jgi:hypothetical protein
MNKRLLHTSYTVLLLASIVIASSCNKILDLEPHNSTFTGAYFTSEQDANTALAGAYAILRNTLMTDNSWHVYGDVPSGELSVNGNFDSGNSNIAQGLFTGLNVGGNNWNWQNYYKLLQQVNLIINKVPGISEDKFASADNKRHIIGEAYFLRAYTYFYMSRIWGAVPLKLAPDLNADEAKNIPRSPADSVIKQCLVDVTTAKEYLDFGYQDESQRAVRANKGSVFALEAHIKAWKGDYAGCEIAANEVITKGGYSLVDSANYSKVFVGKSQEGIFEINVDDGQNEGISLIDQYGNFNGAANVLMLPTIAGKTFIQWPVSSFFVQNLYPDSATDIRYRKFFYQPRSDEGQIIKYSNITYADGSGKTLPRMANNMIIFRLADIILLRAEALNKLDRDGDALPLLNQVRKRANAPDLTGSGELLGTMILEERLRELFYEGHAYYDLVRTRQLTNYNESFSGIQFDQGGWLWPIDPNMFKDDLTLVQTPYWQGKL